MNGGSAYSLVLGGLSTTALESDESALALQTLRSNKTLDLRSLGVGLLALTLGLDLTANDETADIVLLVETEELADLGGTLGTQALRDSSVGQTGDLGLASLDDGEGDDSEILTGDGTTDGLALALTSAAGAVAGVAVGEEELDTGGEEDYFVIC